MKKYIIVRGKMSERFIFFGPFDSLDDAWMYGDAIWSPGEYDVVELLEPS